jgi:hypothetical protein
LEASWVDKALKGKEDEHKDGKIEWEKPPYRAGGGHWTPRIVLRNEVEYDEQTNERWFTPFFYDDEGSELEWPVVCERRNSTATFAEHFELQAFPYDAQDLSITLMSARAIIVAGQTEDDAVRLVQNLNPHYVSTVDVGSFILSDEYRLYDSVICYEDITSAKNSSSKSQYALISYSLKIVRIPLFYQLNIMVPMFFVVFMTFFSCLFEPKELGERLQVTLTLYLTAVAYKLVGADYLPKIGYTTQLDEYLIGGGVVMIIIAFENAACKIFPTFVGTTLDWTMGLLLVYWLYYSAVQQSLWNLVSGKEVDTLTNLEEESGMRYPRDASDKAVQKSGKLQAILYQKCATESMWGELGSPMKEEVQKRWEQAHRSGWKSPYANQYAVCIHEIHDNDFALLKSPKMAPAPGWSSPQSNLARAKLARGGSQGKKKEK